MTGITERIYLKLEKILCRLKSLNIIRTFKLEVDFCVIDNDLKGNLKEIDGILKKCLKKIFKPKPAELRNVISELIRKKNLYNELSNVNHQKLTKNGTNSKENFIHKKKFNCEGSSKKKIEKYYCKLCGKNFQYYSEWKCHEDEKLCLNTFTCIICHKIFKSFEEHKSHVKIHSIEDKFSENLSSPLNRLIVSLPSKTQGKSDKNVAQANNLPENVHLSKFPPIESEQYMCKCGKVFRLLKTLRKHESIKHSANNIKYTCDLCKKSFQEKCKLNRHMLSHKAHQYGCTQCSKRFARSDALRRHVDIIHQAGKEFSCNYCDKKFNLKQNKNVHEENVHKNLHNWLQCEHCGNKLRNLSTLKSHMKIHSSEQIFCIVCCKSFSRKMNYRNHLERKHLKVFLK